MYYALVIRGRINPGDKVLIHSGSGGVGQAAISVALHHGCEVFTTVGSEEKRKFLKSRFPQLQDDHFCNSRDVSFEKNILTVTKGKGIQMCVKRVFKNVKLQLHIYYAKCRCTCCKFAYRSCTYIYGIYIIIF